MCKRKPLIVLAESYDASAIARLRDVGDVVVLRNPTPLELRAALVSADALLVRTYTRVTGELLEGAVGTKGASLLRVVGRGGVGLDNIDLEAARRRGVRVVYTPAASTRSVAEHAVALMLALRRQLISSHRAVLEDSFHIFRKGACFEELGGGTVGVIGMGRVGSTFARICALGFGMRVLYNDIVPIGPLDFPVTEVDKNTVYAEADVVSLHVPLTPHTHRMIDAEALMFFKPTAILLNTARGAVVDGVALAGALEVSCLAGAGLDVYDPEPLPADHPLRTAPNVLMTPHVAGRSPGAMLRMNNVVEDVIAVLEGRTPRFAAC